MLKKLIQLVCFNNYFSSDSRCEIDSMGMKKRGVIKYVGTASFASGIWIGVHLDEPTGKNDGSVKGKRYFTCPNKYGSFVKPENVQVGDFPEFDIDEL